MKSPRIFEVFVLLISSVWAKNTSTSFVDVCDNGNQVCSALPSTISVIDILPLLNNSTELEKSAVRNLIGAACRTWGMFYIKNHGLETIAKDFELEMKNFFHSSKTVKNSIRRQADNSRGFADDELTKQKTDMKEIFDVGHKPVRNLPDDAAENRMLDGYNQWPISDNLLNFRGTVESYYDVCSNLAATLLSAISYDLGVSPTILGKSFEEHTSFLRLNYYPILHESKSHDLVLGINRHTDAGVLTLLHQDSNSALEVYSGSKEDNNDGVWVPVDPIPGCLAVNVCDMLQVQFDKHPHTSLPSSSMTSRKL
jgi:isopenicillin N synthase-like dioxygenase